MANEFVARRGIISLGGITFPTRQITSTTTFGDDDFALEVTSGTFTVNLPTAVGILFLRWCPKKLLTSIFIYNEAWYHYFVK